jgi:hypothetical protein
MCLSSVMPLVGVDENDSVGFERPLYGRGWGMTRGAFSATRSRLGLLFYRLSFTFYRPSFTFFRLSLTFYRLSLRRSP